MRWNKSLTVIRRNEPFYLHYCYKISWNDTWSGNRKISLSILYSDKTKYVLEDLGFHGEYADLRDQDSLSFENAKKNLESGYKIDVTESIQNAEKNF